MRTQPRPKSPPGSGGRKRGRRRAARVIPLSARLPPPPPPSLPRAPGGAHRGARAKPCRGGATRTALVHLAARYRGVRYMRPLCGD